MAKHLSITGIVQGVGYRVTFQEQARALGLSGWVRNRTDGSVEAIVSGDARAIEKLMVLARRGPAGAAVSHIEVTEVDDPSVTEGRFQLLPTM